MIRKIIHIDEEKCNGCGACAAACHEGAIGMVGGKAKLLRDDYCDGLGDCLPACPTGAITFVEREAAAYDEAAVLKNKQEAEIRHAGCPGQQMRRFNRDQSSSADTVPAAGVSQLRQWPCQIKLLPVNAPYLNGAKLLIAADCTASVSYTHLSGKRTEQDAGRVHAPEKYQSGTVVKQSLESFCRRTGFEKSGKTCRSDRAGYSPI